jgi:hypothetical protein
MNHYPEMQIVEIIIPYTDPNGAQIVPTEISVVLLDGEDVPVLDFGLITFNPSAASASVIVPSIANALRDDELQEVRRLDIRIAHTGGFFRTSQSYVIEAQQSLQIMRNSFMTYETARMLAGQFVNLTTFTNSSDDRQRAALSEAYFRITDLPMIYSITDTPDVVGRSYRISRSVWKTISADAFRTQFPTHFKRALRAAQLAEADDLLQGNVISKKHAQGIATETIGESSVTLRPGFASGITEGIGTAALTLLSGYIDRTMRVGRV